MPNLAIVKSTKILFVTILFVQIMGCNDRSLFDYGKEVAVISEDEAPKSLLTKIIRSGKIIFITRNAPTTYYIGSEGAQGFEHDLALSFADAFGLDAEFIIKDNVQEVIDAVNSGEGHIAVAGIAKTEKRMKKYTFGPTYQKVRQQVVCHRSIQLPNSIAELSEKDISVSIGSSYDQHLDVMKINHPELNWVKDLENTTEQVLWQVVEKEVDCTVADSNIVKINRRYYPELEVAMPLGDEQELGWVVPDGAVRLQDALEYWMKHFKKSDKLSGIHHRYYGHFEIFDYVNLMVFHRRIKSRLPKYRKLFEEAGEKYNIPWTTLAAQSYQESHWNPRAKSPTGVRGLMMLTLSTARSMGYKSRLSPENSIMGGARYLAKLQKRVSQNIQGPDRLWYALAAYNVGMGHVRDAQVLAHEAGKNPNEWRDLRSILPLLSKKEYYKKTRFGYARGTEPVRYVQRIREFKLILDQLISPETDIIMGSDIDIIL